MKKKPYKELEEIARAFTFEALKKYVIPDEIRENIALITLFEEDNLVFVLYVPGEKPSDAHDISRTTVNAFSGVATISVVGLELK